MVTQSDIVRFLFKCSDDSIAQILDTSILDLGLARNSGDGFVLVVEHSWSCLKAVEFMAENQLHAVAVVHNTVLIGTLSLSDLRHMQLPFLIPDLTVGGFLRCSHHVGSLDQLPQNVVCNRRETLRAILQKILKSRVHRIWVVESSGSGWNPISVITLTDILALISERT